MAINRSLLYKELSKKDSDLKIKELLKERIYLSSRHFKPGNLILTSYNAKHKEFKYDKIPLALVLVRGQKYSLVLNFHWLPVNMRINLIYIILKMNKRNIQQNKPLEFSYKDLKPLLKKFNYAPCIRKYINGRMGKTGIVIPPDRLIEVARLQTEVFTGGKYSSTQLYSMAKKAGRKRAAKK